MNLVLYVEEGNDHLKDECKGMKNNDNILDISRCLVILPIRQASHNTDDLNGCLSLEDKCVSHELCSEHNFRELIFQGRNFQGFKIEIR